MYFEYRRDVVAKTRNLDVVQTEKHLHLALMVKAVAAPLHGMVAVQMAKLRPREKILKVSPVACFSFDYNPPFKILFSFRMRL